jgi:hypothetical protein
VDVSVLVLPAAVRVPFPVLSLLIHTLLIVVAVIVPAVVTTVVVVIVGGVPWEGAGAVPTCPSA